MHSHACTKKHYFRPHHRLYSKSINDNKTSNQLLTSKLDDMLHALCHIFSVLEKKGSRLEKVGAGGTWNLL